MKNDSETDKLAKIIWDYHLMQHKLQKSDLIIILGGSHIQVPKYGAELYLQGWAPMVVVSGGFGKVAKRIWGKTEAGAFQDVLVKKYIPKNKIILEKKSTNTGENVMFTKELLNKKGIMPKQVIAVHKPFMERRTFATFRKIWPKVRVIVTSPQIPFDEYKIEGRSKDYLINSIVGYLQRIKEYPKQGFQIKQTIPERVWNAYETLVGLGYNKHLIRK